MRLNKAEREFFRKFFCIRDRVEGLENEWQTDKPNL